MSNDDALKVVFINSCGGRWATVLDAFDFKKGELKKFDHWQFEELAAVSQWRKTEFEHVFFGHDPKGRICYMVVDLSRLPKRGEDEDEEGGASEYPEVPLEMEIAFRIFTDAHEPPPKPPARFPVFDE